MKCAVQMGFLHRVAGDMFLLNFYISSGRLKYQIVAAALLEGCMAGKSCLSDFPVSFTLSTNKAAGFPVGTESVLEVCLFWF